jgi:lysophospholipase L1-like esterase
VEKYATAVYEVAKAHGTLFANLFEDMTNKKIDWRTYLSDGLHLSESGSIAFFNVLFPVVKRMLKAHPFLLPLWTDIDFAEPSALF